MDVLLPVTQTSDLEGAERASERASERAGDDATSRNRYLRTAPGGRARAARTHSPKSSRLPLRRAALCPSFSFDLVCRPRSRSRNQPPLHLAFSPFHTRRFLREKAMAEAPGAGRDQRPSFPLANSHHSLRQSLRRVSPFPSSCLPTRRPSLRRRHLRFSLFTSE